MITFPKVCLQKTYQHCTQIIVLLERCVSGIEIEHGKDAMLLQTMHEVEQIDDKSKTKALYRKGMGYILVKDEEQAQKILEEALELEPNDAAIQKGLQEAKHNIKLRRDKQKEGNGQVLLINHIGLHR